MIKFAYAYVSMTEREHMRISKPLLMLIQTLLKSYNCLRSSLLKALSPALAFTLVKQEVKQAIETKDIGDITR